MRYCYLVRGTETDIVGIWSGEEEAIEEAKAHAKDSGVKKYAVKQINDEVTVIEPTEYETYEKVVIYRHILR